MDAPLNTGYATDSACCDVWCRMLDNAPVQVDQQNSILKASWMHTKLGPMMAIADESGLYLLEFVDRRGLKRKVERLRRKKKAAIIPGVTAPLRSIACELSSYFDGKKKEFNTPLQLIGSPFQRRASINNNAQSYISVNKKILSVSPVNRIY
jgi:AraC family transcriptional regulator of adaptative response/methylated-DNA-[protein]-cysteine methyltransferase